MNIKDIIVIASCRPTSVRHLIKVPNDKSPKIIGPIYWCTVFKLCSIRTLLHFLYWISHVPLKTKDCICISFVRNWWAQLHVPPPWLKFDSLTVKLWLRKVSNNLSLTAFLKNKKPQDRLCNWISFNWGVKLEWAQLHVPIPWF